MCATKRRGSSHKFLRPQHSSQSFSSMATCFQVTSFNRFNLRLISPGGIISLRPKDLQQGLTSSESANHTTHDPTSSHSKIYISIAHSSTSQSGVSSIMCEYPCGFRTDQLSSYQSKEGKSTQLLTADQRSSPERSRTSSSSFVSSIPMSTASKK